MTCPRFPSDRYSIDDAVADGATAPIRYTSRKAEWHVDLAKIDILFDNWFADEPEERLEAIKERGVTIAELAKHPGRIDLLAFDPHPGHLQNVQGIRIGTGLQARVVQYRCTVTPPSAMGAILDSQVRR